MRSMLCLKDIMKKLLLVCALLAFAPMMRAAELAQIVRVEQGNTVTYICGNIAATQTIWPCRYGQGDRAMRFEATCNGAHLYRHKAASVFNRLALAWQKQRQYVRCSKLQSNL